MRLSVLTRAMLALSVTVCKIFTVEMYMTLTLTIRMGQCQLLIFQWKTVFLFVDTCNFALSVTVCEIFTVEMCMTLTLTFRMVQGHVYMAMVSWATYHFICVVNSNVCSICHRLRDNHA